jgi:hypothetical protein
MALVEQEERFASNKGAAAYQGASGAVVVTCPTGLQRILRPDMALAVWRRSLDDNIVTELDSLMLDEVDDILFTSGTAALETTLADVLEAAGYSAMLALRRDIVMLASQHAAVSCDGNVTIRLEVVETDACRKFHTDYVSVRTITTYLGQGTQWIEANSVEQVGASGGPEIFQMDAGDIGMFKGRLWQETPTILHRSPPIGGSGEQRLVLVIDSAPREDKAVVRLGGACA